MRPLNQEKGTGSKVVLFVDSVSTLNLRSVVDGLLVFRSSVINIYVRRKKRIRYSQMIWVACVYDAYRTNLLRTVVS